MQDLYFPNVTVNVALKRKENVTYSTIENVAKVQVGPSTAQPSSSEA